MHRVARYVAAAVALTIGAAGSATAQDFRWAGALEAGQTVEVRGVNGSIVATAAAGAELEVLASKRSERSDPASVTIEVVEDARGVLVCAVYPARSGRQPNRCARSGGQMNVSDNDVMVDFTLRVPAGRRLDASTVNGGITATGLSGHVQASTVNGDVRIETAGAAAVETVNGSITAALGSLDSALPLRFETVNGGITVTLPADTRANVEAETLNGELSSDFELTVKGRFRAGMRRLEGTIGGGGARLSMETVNGSIRLRRGG